MARTILMTLMCGLLVLGQVAPAAAQGSGGEAEQAEEEKKEKKEKKKGRSWGKTEDGEEWGAGKSQQMGPRLYKKYIAAFELYQEEQLDSAIKILSNIRMSRLTPYERSKIYELLGFCAYAKEDTAGTRDYMQKALDEDGFLRDKNADIQFTIARLYASDQEWDNAIASLDKWFAIAEKPSSAAYNLQALVYFQQQDYDSALEPAQKAVDLAVKPNEGWLRLLLAIRLTKQHYKESVPVLESLVANFPKKAYWLQLSTVHGALGSYEKALVPLQLAHAQDLLETDAEVRRLSQLLMFLELPYRSALVLEEGLDDEKVDADVDGWEMLSNSWIAAREYEKAVAPLETAAQLDPTGDLFVRLAQVHIQREKWAEATRALSQGIAKGELEKPGDALLLMGIAHYSNKSPATARSWFVRARGHADSRKEADTWIQYVDRELAAQAAAGGGQAEAPATGG
ncbi:MAG: tetratricopeptide repeat protein [Deltaproteobacteria bacterium]|nr:tetratricopeptide repeat protein [Deltaproteobacteria bacterium]MBW2361920.1 tetratricopeptide repeat protein [Deltaproteobacteria bacterium]